MNRISTFIIIAMTAVCASAQNRTLRQQNFPVALSMTDENIEWQRDIYREISLYDNENAGLYCPAEESAKQKGLFTSLFYLAVSGKIPVYKYSIDGNEVFNSSGRADIKDILTNHHIFFEEDSDHIVIDWDDVPAQEVVTYYIKEGVYYDLTNSSFRIKVLALCPVIVEDGEFSIEPMRYPLFWVEFKDLEPYLHDLTIIADYKNMAMSMPMTDYFTLNKYKGSIYKVSNPFGYTLRQMVDSDSDYVAAQKRIEAELKRVTRTTYNTYYVEKDARTKEEGEKLAADKPKKNLFAWLTKPFKGKKKSSNK